MKLSLVTGKVERDIEFKVLIASILEHTKTPAWELVIVDASMKPYLTDHPNIRVIHENPRETHTRGYNKGFKAARGEYILWLNDDAEVCPGYDVEAIRFMEAHPKIGLGALHYSDEGGPFHANSAWGCTYANFGIFKKSVGELVGYFDEDLTMYGADNSLALKILMSDFGVADIPEAKILHHRAHDNIRNANQANRVSDNRILTEKYMQFRRYWVKAFKSHQIVNGKEVWPHGMPQHPVETMKIGIR